MPIVRDQFPFSLSAVERYDLINDTWDTLLPMQESRAADLVGATLGSCLYVCGGAHEWRGKIGTHRLGDPPSAERFTPAGNWESLPSMLHNEFDGYTQIVVRGVLFICERDADAIQSVHPEDGSVGR